MGKSSPVVRKGRIISRGAGRIRRRDVPRRGAVMQSGRCWVDRWRRTRASVVCRGVEAGRWLRRRGLRRSRSRDEIATHGSERRGLVVRR